MELVRFSPLYEFDRELGTLQRQMSRFLQPWPWTEAELKELSFAPAVEVKETDAAIELRVELPGIDPKDLDLQVTAEAVVLKGERRSEDRSEAEGVLRTEFRYGAFERVIPLPAQVKNTEAQADYQNGILVLTLPKRDEELHKVVKVDLGHLAAAPVAAEACER